MTVTIPSCTEHNGIYATTYEISDFCPVCNGPRGKLYGALSYDGSRRLHVDGWKNPCGHIDKYEAVRQEGRKVAYKQPTAIV